MAGVDGGMGERKVVTAFPRTRVRTPGPVGTAEVVDAVAARQKELVGSVTGAAEVELAPYTGPLRGAVRAAIAADLAFEVEAFLTCIREARPMTDVETQRILPLPSLPAEVRVPRYALLRIHRLVLRSIWGALRASIEEADPNTPPERGAWARLSGGVHVLEAQVIAEMATVGLRTAERLIPAEGRPARTGLQSLLAGDLDRFLLIRAAGSFRETLGTLHIVAAIGVRRGPGPATPIDLHKVGGEVAAMLETASRPLVSAPDEGTVAVVVPLAEAGAMAQALEQALAQASTRWTPLAAGIGRCMPGLAGIAQSYRQAQRALGIAATIRPPTPPLLTFDRALPYLMLNADLALARYCWEATFGKVVSKVPSDFEQLHATIEAFVESRGALSPAAERLGVHRHTLTSRLKRFERLSGLSTTDPEDFLLLSLGLCAARIISVPTGSPED